MVMRSRLIVAIVAGPCEGGLFGVSIQRGRRGRATDDLLVVY